jgi:hypothetical protein
VDVALFVAESIFAGITILPISIYFEMHIKASPVMNASYPAS